MPSRKPLWLLWRQWWHSVPLWFWNADLGLTLHTLVASVVPQGSANVAKWKDRKERKNLMLSLRIEGMDSSNGQHSWQHHLYPGNHFYGILQSVRGWRSPGSLTDSSSGLGEKSWFSNLFSVRNLPVERVGRKGGILFEAECKAKQAADLAH